MVLFLETIKFKTIICSHFVSAYALCIYRGKNNSLLCILKIKSRLNFNQLKFSRDFSTPNNISVRIVIPQERSFVYLQYEKQIRHWIRFYN